MVIHLNRLFAQPVASICLSLCNYRFSMKLLYVQASAPICANLGNGMLVEFYHGLDFAPFTFSFLWLNRCKVRLYIV